MQYLATDLALYSRLVGAPLDFQGRPKMGADGLPFNRHIFGPPFQNRFAPLPGATGLAAQENRWPSYGIRIPYTKEPFKMRQGLTSNDPQALRFAGLGFQSNSYRQVPVFDENVDSRDWANIWPCVTFKFQREEPQFETFIYSDDFEVPVGNPVNILNADGQIIQSGKDQIARRQHPDSYDLYYLIRAFSKNLTEVGLICDAIKYIFPQRSSLEVQFADGTSHVCDMIMEDAVTLDLLAGRNKVGSIKAHGVSDMALTDEEQDAYCRGFVYKIEGYYDNTINAYGTNDIYNVGVVTQRILEIATLQDQLLDSQDLNKIEFQEIP